MSKKKYAVIWRKSVYDTHCCPQCNSELIDRFNQPINTVEVEIPFVHKTYLLCQKCKRPVAFIEPYDGPLKPGGMYGHWNGGKLK